MSKSTKTTTENKPPAWAAPAFELAGAEAMRLYESGAGGNTYLGSTVAPLSDTTMSGVNQMAQAGQNWDTSSATRPLYQGIGAASLADPTANILSQLAGSRTNTSGIQGGTTDTSNILSGWADRSNLVPQSVDTSGIQSGWTDISRILGAGGGGASNVSAGSTDTSGIVARDVGTGSVNSSGVQAGNTDLSSLIAQMVGTGGYENAENAASGINPLAQGLLGGIASGQQGITNEADWRGILERAQGPSAAEQYLTQYAAGDYLNTGNPIYRERLDGEIERATAQIQSAFSGAGRYGSGANTDVLSRNTQQMTLEALEEDWNREQQNQFAATGMIDQARQGQLGVQLGAAEGITGVQGQNIANRLAGSGRIVDAATDSANFLRQIQDSRSTLATADADRMAQMAQARAGFDEGNQDRSLTAALSRAGIDAGNLDRLLSADTGNAERALQAAISRAGFDAGDQDRGLTASIANSENQSQAANRALQAAIAGAGFQSGDLDRNLSAATTQAGFQAGNADRSLQAALADVGFQQADLDRYLNAATTTAGFQQADLDRNLGAATTRAGLQAGDLDRSLQASGLAGEFRGSSLDRALAATGAMSTQDQQNFQNQLTGAQATLDAGGMMDQQAQQLILDEIAQFYALDNEEWTRLSMLESAAAGAAGNYGTQVATQRQPINPWGAIGAMFSGKSDVRLKENIVAIGKANGINVYEFSYKGTPDRWIGVMAQELPIGSDAVSADEHGYLEVNYARLGFPMMAAS